MNRNSKDKTPLAASLDQKDNLIELREETLADGLTRNLSKTKLYEAAAVVKPPGYRHTGSVAIHFYWSELTGPSFVSQIQVGDTGEYVTALAFNKLFKQMKAAYGYEQKEKTN